MDEPKASGRVTSLQDHRNLQRRNGGACLADNDRWVNALKGQNEVLELVARGAALETSLGRLAAVVEGLFPKAFCTISLLDTNRPVLALVAAPTLPESYKTHLETLDVVPGVHPCGTAVSRREPVVIAELCGDPFWAAFEARARDYGIHACWSQPILGRDGEPLGSVALYNSTHFVPADDDCRLLDAICPLARLAIEQHRNAKALEQADLRFASLAANIPGVVYQRLVTPDGDIRYTYISDGALDLFGVSPAEVLSDSQALFDCHGAEYRKTFRERLLAASRDLTMWDVEASIVSRDGQHKWTHAIARPEAQPDGSVLWNGIILDSTRIKQANLELAAASRAKSEFLATVSHELRTPLNAIIGFSEIMLRETLGALGNDAYREYAQDIHDSGNHLLKIINEILDLTRIEAGKVELDEEVIALDPMIRSCIRLIAGRLEERALSVVYEPESPGVTLRADERKLRQILINLLSNAIKFTSDGSSVRVCTRLDPTGELVLSVSDSGTGIGADDLAKVFDPFFQAQSGLARGYEGLGLGLPLTKGLVELHKGRIEIDSELDSGTIVTVTFPAERVVT